MVRSFGHHVAQISVYSSHRTQTLQFNAMYAKNSVFEGFGLAWIRPDTLENHWLEVIFINWQELTVVFTAYFAWPHFFRDAKLVCSVVEWFFIIRCLRSIIKQLINYTQRLVFTPLEFCRLLFACLLVCFNVFPCFFSVSLLLCFLLPCLQTRPISPKIEWRENLTENHHVFLSVAAKPLFHWWIVRAVRG